MASIPTCVAASEINEEKFTISKDRLTPLLFSFLKVVKSGEVIHSSDPSQRTVFSKNGFVNAAIECCDNQHNLIIRPDDIWIAILTQLSFYIINGEFKSRFANEVDKPLEFKVTGAIRTVKKDAIVKLLLDKIAKHLNLKMINWIFPAFSTTTDNDLIASGAVFMSKAEKYSKFNYYTFHGIPSITIKGTLEDWKEIAKRLEKLTALKLEKWLAMLNPVVQQFVETKQGRPNREFWERICTLNCGSGGVELSGWITVFCVFNEEGTWQGKPNGDWMRLETCDIPTGVVNASLNVLDDNGQHEMILSSGHVGMEVKEDGLALQPVVGWHMNLKAK